MQGILPKIEIDERSGFCFGVVNAISKAEEELQKGEPLYCLGDIVHNSAEVERLRAKGMETICHGDLPAIAGAKVLLRAHGEPPSTYLAARRFGITVIDATCPVVLKLQQRIKSAYDAARSDGRDLQIVIYGRRGHAEVNGLVGQTDGKAIVIESIDELDSIDFSRPVSLYSQTTKSLEGFQHIIAEISQRMTPGVSFEFADTICRSVANRAGHLHEFAARHDVILFVAGAKSSNGKILFSHCHDTNPRSWLVPGPDEIQAEWLRDAGSIGICGATSTPSWLMEQVAERAARLCRNAFN